MQYFAFRLKPKQDLKKAIDEFISAHKISAATIITCVGSLSKATIRLNMAKVVKEITGNLEIVSLVGTLEAGNSHLHLSIANEEGAVIGGHLLEGSIVMTTAEVVIGVLDKTVFKREMDEQTGFKELVIQADSNPT
jgi:predicted DNA-binding protein with PD1-like motif